jgi:hypothetical protein
MGLEAKVPLYAALVLGRGLVSTRGLKPIELNRRTRSTGKVSISDKAQLLEDVSGSGANGLDNEDKEHNGGPETSDSWTPDSCGTKQSQTLKTKCDGCSIRNAGHEHPREAHALIQELSRRKVGRPACIVRHDERLTGSS